MAQVKKFQPGGKLTINGKDYTIDQLNEYMNSGGFSSQERAALAGTIQSIAGGASRTFDRNANSISGEGVTDDFTGFYGSEKRAERNQGKSTRWANRQARRNSDHHIVNSALERLGGIEDYYNKKKEKESEKTRLYKGSDANGFYTSDGRFLEGPENSQNISRITAIFDALQSGDLSKYDLQDWGGDTTLSGLADWYTAQNGGFNRSEFFTRLRNNQLTDLDWEILSKMGFDTGTTPQTDSKTSHKDWKGNADAATRAGVYFTKNADGTWNINGNQDYLNNTWYAGGLDFLTGTDFEGGAIHNGKLYTRQQVLNNDPSLQGAFSAWMTARDTAKDHRSWYDLANASGVRFVGDRTSRGTGADDYGIFTTQFNPYTHYNEHWSDYFKGLNLGNRTFDVADMSPAYTNLDGRQVLAYIDPNNTHDNMGIRSVKYVVRNTDGTYTQYDSEDALKSAGFVTNSDAYGFTPGEIRRDLWETIGNKRYHFAHDLVTFGDQNNVIMQGEDGKFYLARKNGDQHLNPQLIKNEELLKQMLENPQNYKNVDLGRLTKNPSRSWFGNNSSEGTVAIPGDWATTREATWNGYTVSEKQGGSIPAIKPLPEKFQYGGNVGKTKTTTKDNSTEGKRTDITATHKANGSDGGLTDAEKMQIAAAVGDLAGVGLSFVPGAHIAGSIAGLGATATRFAADVKKDGFQGKDFWSALGGAALDVASLVPILGTAAKTGKAVKALKAAATPIMKVLSVAGAINGANAMGKVIRGEEVTSEDITAILSGLGSAAVAGKQLKDTIGDARLARQVAQKSKAAITGEKLGKTLPKSRKEISELLENAGTEKKAIDKVKELLGNNATDEVAKGVLNEWGVDTNQSRFKGKEGWKEYLKFWKKGESTVSMKIPDTNVKSVLGYTLNSFARTKQLGYDIGYKQSSGNLGQISKKEYLDAMKAVRQGTASGKQIALVRRSSINPEGFSFELGDVRNVNSGWGWPIMGRSLKYDSPASGIQVLDELPGVRGIATPRNLPEYSTPVAVSQVLPEIPGVKGINVDPKIPVPNPFAQRQSFPDLPPVRPQSVGELVPIGSREPTPIVGGITNSPQITQNELANVRSLMANYAKLGGTPDDVYSYVAQLMVSKGYNPTPELLEGVVGLAKQRGFLKKGGKITKHQNTSVMPGVPNYLKDVWGEIGGQLYQPTMVDVNNPGSSVSSIVQSAIAANKGDAAKGDAAREDVNFDPTAVKTNYSVNQVASDKNPTKVTSYNYSSLGSQKGDKSPGTGLGWKIAGNMFGVGAKAGSAYAASKQQMDLAKQMEVPLQTAPARTTFRYKDPGIDLAYDKAIGQHQNYARNFKSTDSNINTTVGLQTADKVGQLELDRGLKKAQVFQEQLNQHNAQLRNQSLEDTARMDANNKLLASKKNALLQQKGAYIAQNQGITQGLISDVAGIGQQVTAGKKALAAFDAKNTYSDNMSGLRTQYQTGINNGSIASGTSFDDWAMANHKKDIRSWQRDYLAAKHQYKKGGRIRPASEQIKIDNEKARHKAIAQLSKQAFELLKMALK